jgi:hypothetical protein
VRRVMVSALVVEIVVVALLAGYLIGTVLGV